MKVSICYIKFETVLYFAGDLRCNFHGPLETKSSKTKHSG